MDLLDIEITPRPGTGLAAYAVQLERARGLLDRLADKIDNLTADAAITPDGMLDANRPCWGHAGTLQYINERLADLLGDNG